VTTRRRRKSKVYRWVGFCWCTLEKREGKGERRGETRVRLFSGGCAFDFFFFDF